jgi:hypothetical protein
MEFERRRRIGVTIDAATAETTSWWSGFADPYGMLPGNLHDGTSFENFARNPGGEWVRFGDLPEATEQALSERDECELKGNNVSDPPEVEPPPYEAELQRRRRIGETIDPATAETEFRWVDSNDPYEILDEKYHGKDKVYEYFVRNPGACQMDWVHLYDLPKATRTAFRARDARLIDLAEYEMESERRRRAGVTIDSTRAETIYRWVVADDPYGMLASEFHKEGMSEKIFARNPGGEWVVREDWPQEVDSELFFEALRRS